MKQQNKLILLKRKGGDLKSANEISKTFIKNLQKNSSLKTTIEFGNNG